MSAAFHVRESRRSDLAALLAVWRRAVAATHDFVTAADRAAIDRAVAEDYLPGAKLLVVVDTDGAPVAFLGGSDREVESLFVDPSVHRRGVGRMLIASFAQSGDGELRVEVNEQNDGARAFYEKLGFRVVGRSGLDRQGRPYPLLQLTR
jgi:putative acetyltransferase